MTAAGLAPGAPEDDTKTATPEADPGADLDRPAGRSLLVAPDRPNPTVAQDHPMIREPTSRLLGG